MRHPAFTAYDVRGRVPDDLDEGLAERIAAAAVRVLGVRTAVIGRDARASGRALSAAVAGGLLGQGVDVLDLGVAATEEVCFGVMLHGAELGIAVTASHLPLPYNGLKLIGPGARPVDPASELRAIEAECLLGGGGRPGGGRVRRGSVRAELVDRVLAGVTPSRSLSVVADPGGGAMGPLVEAALSRLPLRVTWIDPAPVAVPDRGIADPTRASHVAVTGETVRRVGADLGLAWDADGDRCVLLDEQGRLVDGCYAVGLLAAAVLREAPGARVVHDRRAIFEVIDRVGGAGGDAVAARAGHAWFKAAMRANDAVYGGELSGHHYWRDLGYGDSGLITAVRAVVEVAREGPLGPRIDARRALFPVSGERSLGVADAATALAGVEARWGPGAVRVDHEDGLSIEHRRWRLNLRASTTEPVLRLNVEGRDDAELVRTRVAEVEAFLR